MGDRVRTKRNLRHPGGLDALAWTDVSRCSKRRVWRACPCAAIGRGRSAHSRGSATSPEACCVTSITRRRSLALTQTRLCRVRDTRTRPLLTLTQLFQNQMRSTIVQSLRARETRVMKDCEKDPHLRMTNDYIGVKCALVSKKRISVRARSERCAAVTTAASDAASAWLRSFLRQMLHAASRQVESGRCRAPGYSIGFRTTLQARRPRELHFCLRSPARALFL